MKTSRFEVFSSFMIALVTIVSAITAWRANIASTQAGDADFEGIAASIRAQEAKLANGIEAFEHFQAFTTYYRYNEHGKILDDEGDPAHQRQKSDLWGLALGLQYSFFSPQYLDEIGNYDLQRELDELWADASQSDDLNPEPHFESADLFRNKASILTGTLIIFASAFFLFTVGQAVKNRLRYLFALSGVVVFGIGVLSILLFELGI